MKNLCEAITIANKIHKNPSKFINNINLQYNSVIVKSWR